MWKKTISIIRQERQERKQKMVYKIFFSQGPALPFRGGCDTIRKTMRADCETKGAHTVDHTARTLEYAGAGREQEDFCHWLRPLGDFSGLVPGALGPAGVPLRPGGLRADGRPGGHPHQRRHHTAGERPPDPQPGRGPGAGHGGDFRGGPGPAGAAAGNRRPVPRRGGQAPGAVHEGPGGRHGQAPDHLGGGGAAPGPGGGVAGAVSRSSPRASPTAWSSTARTRP